MLGKNSPELVTIVDMGRSHVYNPISSVLVCGGAYDVKKTSEANFRSVFLNLPKLDETLPHNFILAEDINGFFPLGTYTDLLLLETDLAQLCEFIIVFSESFGSVAELGSFCMIDEIAHRLIVFISEKDYEEISFIKLGPLRHLENKYGKNRVCIIPNNIVTNLENSVEVRYDKKKFSEIVLESIKLATDQIGTKSSFDVSITGHIAKVMVGLIQTYGALEPDELEIMLTVIGAKLDNSRLMNLVLCCEKLGWIGSTRRGAREFLFPKSQTRAASFSFKEKTFSIMSYKTKCREYYKDNDPVRFNVIVEKAL